MALLAVLLGATPAFTASSLRPGAPDRVAGRGGVLTGRVRDATGGPLPGAAVTIVPEGAEPSGGSGRPRTVFTDAEGRYRIVDLAPGRYSATAELSGFRPDSAPVAVRADGAGSMLDLTLALGSPSETVTVRGERADRSLRETASSVAVFHGGALDARPGLDGMRELLTYIPNVTVAGTDGQAPAVRGVDGTGPAGGADAFFAGTRARLNVQVDGRPSSYNEVVFGDAALWDVAQVEVFRGPQSTLQGRNAVAGSVVVRTKDPTYTREAAVQVGGGNLGTGQIAAMASGPLVADQLAYRVTVDRQTSDSFMDATEPYPGVSDPRAFEALTLRGKLLIEPTALPGFSTLLTISHADHQAPQVESVIRPFDAQVASAPAMPIFRPRSTAAIVETRWKRSEPITFENTLSVTGTDIERRAPPGDGNVQIDGREWVIEPRVRVTALDRRFRAFGGVYVFGVNQDESADLFGGGTFEDRTRTWAAFAEATVAATETLDITVGGRYEQEHRRRLGGIGPFAIDLDETYKVFSPKAGVTWHATPAVTVGAAVARGYNGGSAGFTYDVPFVSYTFDRELVWNYEAFTRADLAGGRVSLTGNLFLSDFTDMQLPFDLNPDPRVWAFVIRNADEARTYGAEIGATWFSTTGLVLHADLGLLKTAITRYPGSGVEGHELARAPAFTSRLGASYRHASGLDLSADARFTDAYYSSITNDPRGKTDPYWLVSASAGYTFARARAFVALANLFNTRAPVLLDPGATTAEDVATLLRPRTVTVNVRVGL